MTRHELCEVLQTPEEAPAEEILASWQRRRSEVGAALAVEGSPKPVKLRLRDELRRLDAAETVAAQLQLAANVDRYLAEYAAECAKPVPVPALLRLCLAKAGEVLPQITDADLRFTCEKKLAGAAEPAPRTSGRGQPPEPAKQDRGAPPRPIGLELHPLPTGETLRQVCPVIRVWAGPCFTLGRQSSASLVTRYLPDTEDNQRRTTTISRIHATMFVRGRQIWVQDGHGEEGQSRQPSRNGTVIDETTIHGPLPLNFAKERRFRLGPYGYEIRVLHVPAAQDPADLALAPPQLTGCVRFEVHSASATARVGIDRAPAATIAAWVFSEVTLGTAPGAAIRLPGLGAPLAGCIRYHEGRFEFAGQPGEPALVLVPGSDQRLAIGAQQFTLSWL